MSFGLPHIRRYLLTGIVTVIPIWITWVIFNFLFHQLSKVGLPWVKAGSNYLNQSFPDLARWLLEPWFQSALAVLLTLLLLYCIGLFTSRVVGAKVLVLLERLLAKIPFVETIYGSIKTLMSVLQQKPDKIQRVVLIEFPSKDMKTVGFVTRVLTDDVTGQALAAVYVPTTPNPTSGYLEIVPLENLVSTDWSMEQAMTFIISAGAVAPDNIQYNKAKPPTDSPTPPG